MADRVDLALRALGKIRSGSSYRQLPNTQRAEMDVHLRQLEAALTTGGSAASKDVYARLLGTPADLQRGMDPRPVPSSGGAESVTPPPPVAPPVPGTGVIGQRSADALEAVNFPGFVAALVTGTFQAIVDASTRQIKEYANLVADLSRSVEDFSRDKVTPNQVRDWLGERYPSELQVVMPAPGKAESPRLSPRPQSVGSSPQWLSQYGLGGQELSEELTEGPLLDAGQLKVGEERLQTLATLVLMGINRVVVSDGDIKARLQFHAAARETTKAEIEAQQVGIAAQQVSSANTTSMLVSTLKANAQADVAIKTDLMGEVRIAFRSETFPLERFADSAAIQLINRHARWKNDPPSASAAAEVPAAPAATEAATATAGEGVGK
jgi:hypothetical protein